MIFIRPWILTLVIIPFLLLLFYRTREKGGVWRAAVDAHLLPFLMVRFGTKQKRTYAVFMSFLWCLACILAAGPAFYKTTADSYTAARGIVIVLDMSPAMNQEALFKARLKIYDLLKMQKGADIGLVLTDAFAYTALPITHDKAILENIIPSVTRDVMPSVGESGAAGIRLAGHLLKQAGFKTGQILVITAGVSDEKALAAAARQSPYAVSILGVGEAASHPVMLPNGHFWEKDGRPVMVSLPAHLNTIGAFRYASVTDEDLRALLPERDAQKKEQTTQEIAFYQDMGVYGLFLLLPLTALLFRKGVFWVLFLGVLASPSWAGPWQRTEQEDYAAFMSGVEAYQTGNYEKAVSLFTAMNNTEALYNKGNALAHQGKIEEAIQTYEAVLKQNPLHKDARFNLEYLKKQLPPPQNEQQNAQGQKDDQDQNQQSSSSNAGQNGSQNPNEPPMNEDQEAQNQEATPSESSKESSAPSSQSSSEQRSLKNAQPDEALPTPVQAQEQPEPSGNEQQPVISPQQQKQTEWLDKINPDAGRILRYRLYRQYEEQIK